MVVIGTIITINRMSNNVTQGTSSHCDQNTSGYQGNQLHPLHDSLLLSLLNPEAQANDVPEEGIDLYCMSAYISLKFLYLL